MATDFIQGLASRFGFGGGNLLGGLQTQLLPKIWFGVKIGFWIVLVMGGAYLLYNLYFKYNKRVTLLICSAGGHVIDVKKDFAKEIRDTQGKMKLVLLKTKCGKQHLTLPIPDSKYKFRSGSKDHYFLWMDSNRNLHPCEMGDINPNLEKYIIPMPEERNAWARYEDKLMREKYSKKDKLEKYLPAALVMGAFVIMFLIGYFGFKELGGGLQALASTFQQVAASCTQLPIG